MQVDPRARTAEETRTATLLAFHAARTVHNGLRSDVLLVTPCCGALPVQTLLHLQQKQPNLRSCIAERTSERRMQISCMQHM